MAGRVVRALLPRHLEIIYEINRRLLDRGADAAIPGDEGRVERDEPDRGGPRPSTCAWRTSPSSARTAPTAWRRSIPSCCATTTVNDFAEMFPERFNNKTNGVTPRRWLLLANPALAGAIITDAIGDGWITDLSQLRKLKPLADDSGFREQLPQGQARGQGAVCRLAQVDVRADRRSGHHLRLPDQAHPRVQAAIAECAAHRRALQPPARRIPNLEMPPRTFFFAGKAAPAYQLAKLIIKFINNLAGTIDSDPGDAGRLKVVFLPEYDVSLAERLIPASDVSNQISTAGYEASGTSNMKFMMNGALTIGTRDGATIEMAEEAGEENIFLFGLTAEQVDDSRGWYNPHWHYENEPETRAALDLIFSDHFSRNEPGVFAPLRDTLLTHGDHYMHLADLKSYLEADQRLLDFMRNPDAWARKAILNVARSGKFSSDRTIREYADRYLGGEAMSSAVETQIGASISPLAGRPAPKEC